MAFAPDVELRKRRQACTRRQATRPPAQTRRHSQGGKHHHRTAEPSVLAPGQDIAPTPALRPGPTSVTRTRRGAWPLPPATACGPERASRGLGRTDCHDASPGRQLVSVRYAVAEREYRRERTGDPRPLLVGHEAEPGRTDAAVSAAMHTAARECEVKGIKLKGLTVNDVPAVGKEHLGHVFDVDVEAHARRRYRSLPSPNLNQLMRTTRGSLSVVAAAPPAATKAACCLERGRLARSRPERAPRLP